MSLHCQNVYKANNNEGWFITTDLEALKSLDYELASIRDLEEWTELTGEIPEGFVRVKEGICNYHHEETEDDELFYIEKEKRLAV